VDSVMVILSCWIRPVNLDLGVASRIGLPKSREFSLATLTQQAKSLRASLTTEKLLAYAIENNRLRDR